MSVSMEESVLHADVDCMYRHGVMTTDVVEPLNSRKLHFSITHDRNNVYILRVIIWMVITYIL